MAHAHGYDSIQVQYRFIQFLCFIDRASRYNRVKNKQLDVQGEHKVFLLITNSYYKKSTWNTNIFFYHYLS